jgi:hypothetical protein
VPCFGCPPMHTAALCCRRAALTATATCFA